MLVVVPSEGSEAEQNRSQPGAGSHLVLVSGLPATGKSTLAVAIAREVHAVVVSRDRIRESLLTVVRPPLQKVDAAFMKIAKHHLPGVQQMASRLLLAAAEHQLSFGHPAVVEVVADGDLRTALSSLASRYEARFTQLECVCLDNNAWSDRISQRGDGWPALLERVRRTYQLPPPEVHRLDSARPPADLLGEATLVIRG
jgi:predicted kinase